MRMENFWYGVRSIVSFPVTRVDADSPRVEHEAVVEKVDTEAALRSLRNVVDKLDVREFEFLSEDDQGRLVYALGRLRHAFDTATTALERTECIRDALLDFVKLFEFDRFNDPEAYRLGKLIEATITSERPPELVELRFRAGADHSGDPGLWVWAFIAIDAEQSPELFFNVVDAVDPLVEGAAESFSPGRFIYLTYRSTLETVEIE